MGTLTINNTSCGAPTTYHVEYGLLYNWWAASDARKITSSDDWIIPGRYTQYDTIFSFLGGASVAGGRLKEDGLTYWDTPNTDAINDVGFNLRGNGRRSASSGFVDLKSLSTNWGSNYNFYFYASKDNAGVAWVGNQSVKNGHAIRLVYVGAGTPTEYVGNDGKVYRMVTIGTKTWLADNLCETKFRNGDIIPWHGTNPSNYFTDVEWAALTTAGVCAYNNDVNNVAPGFTFPS